MIRGWSSVVVAAVVVSLPAVARAQFTHSSVAPVTSVSGSSLSHPVLINPSVSLPTLGTPTQLVIDPGLPGINPSIIGQPLLIVPASALSHTTFGSTLGTTQIFGVPSVPIQIQPSQTVIQNGIVVEFDPPDQHQAGTTRFVPGSFTRTAIAQQVLNSPGVVRLDADLLEATCNQDWKKATQILDRAIADTPSDQFVYRSQLQDYRNRLQALLRTKTTVANWRSKCTGG